MILIGFRWSYGGADRLANILKIQEGYELKTYLWDGDVKGFDHGVKEFLLKLFYSSRLVYFDTTAPGYPLMVKIVEKLIEAVSERITHVLRKIWVLLRGQVPSGCFNTSHMNSWVMAFYFFAYVTLIQSQMPFDLQKTIDEYLFQALLLVIVYGDDHAGALPWVKELEQYINEKSFKKFLWDYFGVVLREERGRLNFVSFEKNGTLIGDKGLVFLRHYLVRNPCREEGQSRYLPYRETSEYMVRLGWGREAGRSRDLLDVMLSALGHVYGTYASNEDAYHAIFAVYQAALQLTGMDERSVLTEVISRQDRDTLRKMRQLETSPETLMRGYPSLELLRSRNIFLPHKHQTGRTPSELDIGYDVVEWW